MPIDYTADINKLYAGNATATAYNPNGVNAGAMAYWNDKINAEGLDAVKNGVFSSEVNAYAKANPLDYTADINKLYAGNATATAYNPNGAGTQAVAYWNDKINTEGLDAVKNGVFTNEVNAYAKANPLDYTADINKLYTGNATATAYNPNGPSTQAVAYWNDKINTEGLDAVKNGIFANEVNAYATAKPTAAPTSRTYPVATPVPVGTPQLNYNLKDVQAATATTVNPATQTVAGQLQSILNVNNPLMQQARSRALQTANANGMLNSSMAMTGADAAMYDKALQIATPDASTNYDANKTSTAATNQFNTASNLFTTQGIMADFNVTANEWAAQQTADRAKAQAAINQTYNLANISANNANTVTNAATAAQVARDAATAQNAFGVTNAATAAKVAADAVTAQNNYGITNAATAAANAATVASTARLYGARADYATSVNAINTSTSMGSQARIDSISALQTNYNTIITQAATSLGWDATSWKIVGGPEAAKASNDAAAGAAVSAVVRDWGGGPGF